MEGFSHDKISLTFTKPVLRKGASCLFSDSNRTDRSCIGEICVFFIFVFIFKKYLWLDLIQWSKTLTPLLKLKTERILPLIICCYMHSSVHVRCSMPELKMQKCIRKPKRACSAQPQATSTCSSKIDQLRKSGRQSLGKGLLLLLLVQRVVYTLALPIFSAEKKRTC